MGLSVTDRVGKLESTQRQHTLFLVFLEVLSTITKILSIASLQLYAVFVTVIKHSFSTVKTTTFITGEREKEKNPLLTNAFP